MPIYEYECRQCGKRTELLQRLDEAPLAACPECGGEVKKLLSAPAVQFKGSGWYVTDYAGKKSSGKAESKPEGGASESSSAKESAPSSAAPSSSGGEAKGTPKSSSSGSD